MNRQSPDSFRDGLADYLPLPAVRPVYDFLIRNGICLKITRSRLSKLGDYAPSCENTGFRHRITINCDLDRYVFLWVLLHEMAHYRNFVKSGRTVKPHGIEWQEFFSSLVSEYIHVFPEELHGMIADFARTLPLKKSLERELVQLFKTFSPEFATQRHVTLKGLKINDLFVFRGKSYHVLEKRRTRFKCLCLDTGKLYLISGSAEVEPKNPKK